MDLRLTDFDSPSEIREFEKGRFEVFEVGPMVLGRATRRLDHSGRGFPTLIRGLPEVAYLRQSPVLSGSRPRIGPPDPSPRTEPGVTAVTPRCGGGRARSRAGRRARV